MFVGSALSPQVACSIKKHDEIDLIVLHEIHSVSLTLERKGKRKHRFGVPFIHAFIGWFFNVPWLGLEPTTSVYWDDTLTNWATLPGLQNTILIPCYSQCGLSRICIPPGAFQKCWGLGTTPDLNWSLHFNKIPKWFVCLLKCEKHYSKACSPDFFLLPVPLSWFFQINSLTSVNVRILKGFSFPWWSHFTVMAWNTI